MPSLWFSVTTRSASAGIVPFGTLWSCGRSSRPFRTWPSSPSSHGLETIANVGAHPCGKRPLQLFSGKGGYPRTEPVGQAHDYIDVAAAAEIGVVLVGALEEDFELDV